MLQAHAPSICPKHSGLAMLRAHAARICTDGRTNGHTETVAHVTSRASLSDTCAHVQDFDDLEKA